MKTADTHLKVHQMLKHIVLSQKKAAKKKNEPLERATRRTKGPLDRIEGVLATALKDSCEDGGVRRRGEETCEGEKDECGTKGRTKGELVKKAHVREITVANKTFAETRRSCGLPTTTTTTTTTTMVLDGGWLL
uniref:Uncharacterized protein n=1 Tax=Vespula pensylvanica TaxID=30213 RepID=A0A834JZ25_VESPE|nr:hypothetical protein H0235_016841 [Vespula pensylvanica]